MRTDSITGGAPTLRCTAARAGKAMMFALLN
jgi:hypothetical protein